MVKKILPAAQHAREEAIEPARHAVARGQHGRRGPEFAQWRNGIFQSRPIGRRDWNPLQSGILRKKLGDSEENRVLLGRSGDVPAAFKQYVEEYYRSLAKKP